MNLGEFIIKIGTQGDTKALDEAIKKMSEAEKKTRKQIKLMQDLAKATSDEEKALIQKNTAQQDELESLKAAKAEHDALNSSVQKNIMSALKFIGTISATVVMLDRMGNSLLKSNQQYITFEKQSGIAIGRLNKMAGLAQLSGMNLSPEQVMGDLQSLQQKFYEFGLGKGTGIFAQMGINPLGMKADDFMPILRQRLKGESAATKSYILSSLGLSQEWLNVIDLSDEKFKEYLKTSKELQLTEKERKKLAEYTAQQQKNNMKWELAKQKLLISILPLIQKIMDVVSEVSVKVANMLEKNPAWLKLVKDILLILTGGTILKVLGSITKLFAAGGAITKLLAPLGALLGLKTVGKGVGGMIGGLATTGKALGRVAAGKGLKTALGMAGKRLLGGAAGFAFGPVVGAIFTIASGILFVKDIYDLIAEWFGKKDQEENMDAISPDPDEGGQRYNYNNVNTAMTNNFFNNPQPVSETINQLNAAVNRYTQYQYR